jgi:bifunctional non-homologous end joining protein LigD
LIPVGQAGSGFTEKTHAEMWRRLQKLKTDKSPFARPPEATRGMHWVKPELVAEIKFTEWTHGSATQKLPKGAPPDLKMRAPVYEGLRLDKPPRECVFERPARTEQAVQEAENGDVARV